MYVLPCITSKKHLIKLCKEIYVELEQGPRFTVILKFTSNLNFKVSDNVHVVVMRKKTHTSFVFVPYYLHIKYFTLNLRSSLSLRNDCEPGSRFRIVVHIGIYTFHEI